MKADGLTPGSVYWPPCHLQPYYRDEFGYAEGDLPVSEDILSRTITLPLFVGMIETDIEYVCESLLRAF